MNRTPALLCLLAALVLSPLIDGCASSGEGGVVGSGISSVVQGNVVEVREAGAGATLPVLIVSLDEVPGIETTTDDTGAFVLAGEFAGPVTVRFRDRATNESLGALALHVALGSTLVLRDVEIRRDLDVPVQLLPPLQLNLDGRVVGVDCAGAILQVADETQARNRFTLRLSASTEIAAADDMPRTCSDILPGDPIRVEEGVVDLEDSLIDAVKLRITPAEPRPGVIRIRRRGTLLRLRCTGNPGLSFQDSERSDVVQAVLSAETDILCGTDRPQPCQCTDMVAGDLIDVSGVRRLDGPDVILATRVQVQRNLEDSFIANATGDVEDIDCGTGVLRAAVREPLADAARPKTLTLLLIRETGYVCARRPCTCEEIGAGDRVRMELRVFTDPERLPEGVQIAVLASPRVAQLRGELARIDCTAGELGLRTRGGTLVRVRLTRETVFELKDRQPTACAALARSPAAVVELDGFVRGADGERIVVATVIRIENDGPFPRSPSPRPSLGPGTGRTPPAAETRVPPNTPGPPGTGTSGLPEAPAPLRSRTPVRPNTAAPLASPPATRRATPTP